MTNKYHNTKDVKKLFKLEKIKSGKDDVKKLFQLEKLRKSKKGGKVK